MSRIFGLEASYIFTLNYQMWFSSENRQELFIEIKFSHIFSGGFLTHIAALYHVNAEI